MVVKNYGTPLTIVGGGEFSSKNFHKCLKIAPKIIAVDSGLNFLNINPSNKTEVTFNLITSYFLLSTSIIFYYFTV